MWLDFADLACGYGRKPVLRSVSLRLGAGLWLLTGANGAGKSTLLRCAAGLLPPAEGRLLWNGEDAYRLAARYRWSLGYAPQESGGYPERSARAYLAYLSILKGIRPECRARRVAEVLDLTGLSEVADRPAETLSGGMKYRLGLAQALLNDPDLLLLDEPTAVLDPEERVRFRQLLLDLSPERILLMATNLPEELESMAAGRIHLRAGSAQQMEA